MEFGTSHGDFFSSHTSSHPSYPKKCSACQKNLAKTHGAPIQCTKGKCPKAFHVSCAKSGEEFRIHFAALREVEKEVVLNEPVMDGEGEFPPSIFHSPEDAPQQMTIDSRDPEGNRDPMTQSSNDTSQLPVERVNEDVEPKVIKTIKKIEYEVLCAQHNPVRNFTIRSLRAQY